MFTRIHIALASLSLIPCLYGQDNSPVTNLDFENALAGWEIHKTDGGKSRATPEAAHTGKLGLLVTDNDETGGSEIRSAPISVAPGETWRARFWTRGIDGKGLGVYLLFTDADGKWLNDSRLGNEIVLTVPEGPGGWTRQTLVAKAPDNAARLHIRIHSYGKATVTACVDDIDVSRLSPQEASAALGGTVVPPEAIEQAAAMLTSAPVIFGAPITDREAWTDFAKRAPDIAAQADALLGKPIPGINDELFLLFKKQGTRVEYERPNRERRVRLRLLTLAECITDTGRYIPAIEETLTAILSEKAWVLPAHDTTLETFEGRITNIDLEAAVRGATVATALTWLGDKLDSRLRVHALTELDRRIIQPYLAKIRSGPRGKLCWWTHAPTNWNAVCHSQVLMTALSIVPDIRTRAEIVAGAQVYLPRYYEGFTPDGYCSEGLGYWGYGFGHYVLLAEALLRATDGRIDLYQPPIIRAVARYPEKLRMAGNVYPSIADCPRYPTPTSWITDIVNARFHGEFSDKSHSLIAAAKDHPIQGTLPEISIFSFPLVIPNHIEANPAQSSDTSDNSRLRGWFPDAGILVCRSGTDTPARLEATLKGGHNAENHNHNDVGGFVLALAGRSPVIDPGLDIYTAHDSYDQVEVKNSTGHSVPLVADKAQRPGRHAAARILRTEFSDEQDVYSLDLTALYDVPQLIRLIRTFTYSRAASGALTITDEVEFSTPQTYETALITFGEIVTTPPPGNPTQPAATAIITDGPACIAIAISATSDTTATVTPHTRLLKTRFNGPPKRLALAFDKPVSHATLTCTLTPQPIP
ncbi:heparinase II/III domain-containing protein [Geminisphaera colitermitum]|uniref:heparinase II/III domain-containing protein n=1 Tax=Geminisphaera colitermitum TaxID=1148786 RepID=UPI000693C79E|nr:heparinase II/III family protein [Geminisphaera colitermitum]